MLRPGLQRASVNGTKTQMDRPQTTERVVLIPVFERGNSGCATHLVGYVAEEICGAHQNMARSRAHVNPAQTLHSRRETKYTVPRQSLPFRSDLLLEELWGDGGRD